MNKILPVALALVTVVCLGCPKMGTGSVTTWFLRLFGVCRRCLSPFSTTRLQFENY